MKEGGIKERMYAARTGYVLICYLEFHRLFSIVRLKTGQQSIKLGISGCRDWGVLGNFSCRVKDFLAVCF